MEEDVQECWAHWEDRQCRCWWGGSGWVCVRRRRVGADIVSVTGVWTIIVRWRVSVVSITGCSIYVYCGADVSI
jgi:hypothetical protein